jgi:N-acetylneuraminate lyase
MSSIDIPLTMVAYLKTLLGDEHELDAFKLKGLIAAPFTPFHEDGSLNLDGIPPMAQALVANGVNGVFVCGTTGEGMSLTLQERQAVAEKWVECAADQLKIVVHVGHTCLADARLLAKHAAQIGAHAVAAMAPCFFRPANAKDLAEFCAVIAGEAPQLPFYFYHIPSMTGVDIPVIELLKVVGHIANFAGVKYTHWDLLDFGQCTRFENGRYDVLFGRDEYMLAGFGLGAGGAIGSTYCFAAPVYQRLLKAFANGDLDTARNEQALAADMIATFAPYGGLPAQKAMMQMIGIDCGPVRLPLRSLSAEKYAKLRSELEAMGFFTRCIK